MTREERRQVIVSLANLVRRLGWENLIEVQIAPETAERGEYDDASARAFVANVSKVVRDLSSLERRLMSNPAVQSIAFKPDPDEERRPKADTADWIQAHRLDREEQAERRAHLRWMNTCLMKLRREFDAG
jgi:hypothetical protein